MHNAYWGAFAALFFCDFLNANFAKLYEFLEKNLFFCLKYLKNPNLCVIFVSNITNNL